MAKKDILDDTSDRFRHVKFTAIHILFLFFNRSRGVAEYVVCWWCHRYNYGCSNNEGAFSEFEEGRVKGYAHIGEKNEFE